VSSTDIPTAGPFSFADGGTSAGSGGTEAVGMDPHTQTAFGVTATADAPTYGSLREQVDGPKVIIETAAGHEIVLTAFDLLMISTLTLLLTDTVLTVAEVFQ
jgi:hypothetical protein